MSLKLYYDLMSQPSRALYILLKTVKCDFESKPVDLRKGQHYSEEYAKVNRLKKVPVIDHNGFVLTESVAILKYLAQKNVIPDSLYPREIQQRARVEEYLAWQHIGLRLHTSMFFRVAYMNPVLSKTPVDPKQVKAYQGRMETALEEFNTLWLGRGTDFITGNQITVADLLAACELEQPRMAGYDPKEKYANIAIWHQKVREHFNPHYDDAHIILNKVVAKYAKVLAKL